jgi:flagellar biosynthesis/type III secretory pathway protein FliH
MEATLSKAKAPWVVDVNATRGQVGRFASSRLLANPAVAQQDRFRALPPDQYVRNAPTEETVEDVEPEHAPETPAAEVPATDAWDEQIAALEQQLEAQQNELAQAKAKAFAEGQAQGQAEAKLMFEQESGQDLDQLRVTVMDEMAQFMATISDNLVTHQNLYDPLKDLSVALAERIAKAELTLNDDSVKTFIEDCIAEVDPLQLCEIVIHVGEAWYDKLNVEPLNQLFSEHQILLDNRLAPGSVRLTVQDTSIEELLETRIDALAAQLYRPLASSALAPSVPEEMPPETTVDQEGLVISGDFSEVDDVFFQAPEE